MGSRTRRLAAGAAEVRTPANYLGRELLPAPAIAWVARVVQARFRANDCRRGTGLDELRHERAAHRPHDCGDECGAYRAPDAKAPGGDAVVAEFRAGRAHRTGPVHG